MDTSRQIRYFLFSQYFADGLRITLEIAIPTIVFSLSGHLETGLMISLGALCVSSADGPGPIIHRKNGMLYCSIFVFLSALLTGILNHNMITLGLFILVSSFFFSMFSIYGTRASSVGFASLLIMVLQMTEIIPFNQAVINSILIFIGGIWYLIVALLLYRLNPHKPAKRALGECIHETAKYLLIKSELYKSGSNLEDKYKSLIIQQETVNEKQNFVRDLLFKNRTLLKEATPTGRLLVLTFADVVDLFEHIMATWYDYSLLREKYASTGILEKVSIIVKELANEIDKIGEAIQSGNSNKKEFDLINRLNEIKNEIDHLHHTGSNIMLKKILVNLRNLGEKTDEIRKYFKEDISKKRKFRNEQEYSRFVNHQQINLSVFKNNFTLKSSVFLHSLRMMITCGVGYLISILIPHGNHSYWIIMTIIIILKPSFSLTRRKNYDRIMGTAGGAIIGLLLLYFIKDQALLFILIIFFMIGTYTFKSLNYIVMVIFLTPYILILFHFLGLGALNVAGERLVDTVIGSLLAILASYSLFPEWESGRIQKYLANVLKANIQYLRILKNLFTGIKISSLEYNLVRKELFVSSANLSSVFNSMMSEPKSKQKHRKEIYEFVTLSHILSSNIASLTAATYKEGKTYPKKYLASVNNSLSVLEKDFKLFDSSDINENQNTANQMIISSNNLMPYDSQMKDQLDFINKVAREINKVTKILVS